MHKLINSILLSALFALVGISTAFGEMAKSHPLTVTDMVQPKQVISEFADHLTVATSKLSTARDTLNECISHAAESNDTIQCQINSVSPLKEAYKSLTQASSRFVQGLGKLESLRDGAVRTLDNSIKSVRYKKKEHQDLLKVFKSKREAIKSRVSQLEQMTPALESEIRRLSNHTKMAEWALQSFTKADDYLNQQKMQLLKASNFKGWRDYMSDFSDKYEMKIAQLDTNVWLQKEVLSAGSVVDGFSSKEMAGLVPVLESLASFDFITDITIPEQKVNIEAINPPSSKEDLFNWIHS